jgi:hypothetical protein
LLCRRCGWLREERETAEAKSDTEWIAAHQTGVGGWQSPVAFAFGEKDGHQQGLWLGFGILQRI